MTLTYIDGSNDHGGWIYTYREIAVERVAWRKHGGPQGFEA